MFQRFFRHLARIQRHQVYLASCDSAEAPDWPPGEHVCLSTQCTPWDRSLSEQVISLASANRQYVDAISQGEAQGLAVLKAGKVVHFGFVLHNNKTACLLGFGKEVGLIANAYTIKEYRGHGCHARSVAQRIIAARNSGLQSVISETSYENIASQRALIKGGMCYLGRVEIAVFFSVLVLRYRRYDKSIRRVGICW